MALDVGVNCDGVLGSGGYSRFGPSARSTMQITVYVSQDRACILQSVLEGADMYR